MKYLLDTVDLEAIRTLTGSLPISGVTSNPSIIKKHGEIDFFPFFQSLRSVIGPHRTLHIQVTAPDAAGMMREAEAIREKIGSKTFIKVPVNEAGLEAISMMKKNEISVTATGIYTKAQAFLALEAGADCLAMYFNRMEALDIDACDTIASAAMMIDRYGYNAEILGASFRNIAQVNRAFEAGAQSVTVDPAILKDALRLPFIEKCVRDFASDWKAIYGDRTIDQL